MMRSCPAHKNLYVPSQRQDVLQSTMNRAWNPANWPPHLRTYRARDWTPARASTVCIRMEV
jgi:hypothetical protein